MPGKLIHTRFVYFSCGIHTYSNTLLSLPLQYWGDLSHSQRSMFEESEVASAPRTESTHGQFIERVTKSTTTQPQHSTTTKSKHLNPRRIMARKSQQATASSSSSSSDIDARVAVIRDDKSTQKTKAAVEKLLSFFRTGMQ